MSYNKLGFTSGQTLKAEHLNHMENGIEAIANNVQIKKVVFTDRQSVYEFLLENYDKTIFIDAKMNGYPSVKFIPQIAARNTSIGGSDNWTISGFPLVEVNMFIYDDNAMDLPTIVPSCIYITGDTTRYLFDPKIGIDSNDVTVVTSSSVEEMPDAYWSHLNIEMTAYYFSE